MSNGPHSGSCCAALLVLALTGAAHAASDAAPGPLFHPDGPGEYRFRAAAGALLDILPRQTVESELRTIPQLTGAVRFGLPAGFSADARVRAIYVSNQLELGVAWSHRVGDFSFALMDHFGAWYGILDMQGFDASGWGYLDQPGVNLGVPLGDIRFSLAVEAIILLAQHVRLGDTTHVSRQNVTLAGASLTLTVENFVGERGDIYYGVAAMYAQPDYQAWIAFSDSRSRVWYPRLLAGYAF
ncbi:MAG: hypothetical protein IPI67_01565 [Myxococcales bacterium]|nr:hypothetical protein [Myxococcales bacterium]